MTKLYPKGPGKYIFGEEENKRVLTLGDEYYMYQDGTLDQPVPVFGCALAVAYLKPDNKLKNFCYLPMKLNNRVFYAECFSCLKNASTDLCNCSREERQCIDTWTFLELAYAARHCDYEIRILQSFVFLESEKLFEEYFRVLSNFKIRYDTCPPDQSIESYVSEVNDAMGFSNHPDLELTPESITPNASMRACIKSKPKVIKMYRYKSLFGSRYSQHKFGKVWTKVFSQAFSNLCGK